MEAVGGGRGVEAVLDSISSPIRLRMLKLLSRKQMNYTELMQALGLSRARDAGKFSYHLKKLISSGLVEVDRGSRKYQLAKDGRLVLDYVERLERKLGTKEMIIVRRSEHLIEPFDKSKIAAALVREAKLTPRLASEVASVAEEKLGSLNIEYLTAPLIRELVNSILLDMGLEKYRHRLTRVGMPVYDVSKLLKKVSETGDYREFMEEATGSVVREYVLLNLLPRKIAEAHLSGKIDLYPLKSWLTGVFARSYPTLYEDGVDAAAAIASELMGVRYEVNLRGLGASELKDTLRVLRALLASGLPRGRIISLAMDFDEMMDSMKVFEQFAEDLPAGAQRRLRAVLVSDEVSAKSLARLDEKFRRLGIRYSIALGGEVMACGYRVEPGGEFSDIHAILSVNAPAAALEAGRDLDRALSMVREAARCGASALKRRLEVFRKVYGKRYRGRTLLVASVCGLFEAAKLFTGAGPQISEESLSCAKEIVSALKAEVGKAGREEMRVASRAPRAAAERMARADASRFGSEAVGGYSYLAVPPRERFRSIDDRVEVEVELARLMEGGHVAVVRSGRRHRMLEEMEALAKGLADVNRWSVIQPE